MNEHKLNKLELREHFQSYMDRLDHCECDDPDCKRPIFGKPHHCLPQTQLYRKLYKEYIDDYRNLKGMSTYCHIHAENWSEEEFCEVMDIEVKSKSGKNKMLREIK